MNTKTILAISIVLNIGLVVTVAFLLNCRPAGAPESPVPVPMTAKASKPAPAQSAIQIPYAVTNTTQVDWRMVESEDYKKYIANLRAIGCPEETIRDIIVADINKLFESRKKALQTSTNKFQFWKTGNFFADMFNEETIKKQQELAAEKRALLKELLGVDVAEKPELLAGFNPYESMLDFLPASKQTEIMELETKFAARMMKTLKDAQKGDFTEMKKVQAEKDAELAKILSPTEKEELDLRISQTAMMMRMQMSSVELTEQEFRDVFKMRKKFDDEFSPLGIPTANKEDAERRSAAQKELDGQIRGILGEQRFVEYKYDGDWNRSSLKKVAEEHNIPKQDALKVFDIRAAAQEEAGRVRADKSLTPEQKQAALDGIRVETEKAVGTLIGAKPLEDYIKKGSWLKNLNKVGGGQTTD